MDWRTPRQNKFNWFREAPGRTGASVPTIDANASFSAKLPIKLAIKFVLVRWCCSMGGKRQTDGQTYVRTDTDVDLFETRALFAFTSTAESR
eukprot:scaffold1384_cov116-Cylindrotheca_fusiformis.AAC.16